MEQLRYQVRFTTPAFLGNAEQSGQWRTPPFKALLRQWWRVAWAADRGFRVDVAAMRREEGLLFGHAWLEDDRDREGRAVAARRSLVRMRLDRWDGGALRQGQWPADGSVIHPEVTNREGRAVPVGSALYLGYGPLTYDNRRRATGLKANAAIQSGESATLSIGVPEAHFSLIERALRLMDRYGALGGRSRNGWGSVALLPLDTAGGQPPSPSGRGAGGEGEPPLRPWRDCLNLDWPHAIGRDEQGPLVWQTEPFPDWRQLMGALATVKIALRTGFAFTTGRNAPRPEPRHWLSYPVTNHSVREWGNARLPNSLRFKAREAPAGRFVGVVFHVPCRPPAAFRPDEQVIGEVWSAVHRLLDASDPINLHRIGE